MKKHSFTPDQERPLRELFRVVTRLVPNLFREDFDSFASAVDNTYGQGNRFFHGPQHLLEMTDQGSEYYKDADFKLADAIEKAHGKHVSAKEMNDLRNINLIAALGHDTEYHVDGKLTVNGTGLHKYVEVNQETGMPTKIRDDLPSRENDPVLHIVLDLFNMKAGDPLSPFKGQNEFLSALSMAKELELAKQPPHVGVYPAPKKLRVDSSGNEFYALSAESMDFITGVVASIEATVPFKSQEGFQQLKPRLAKVMETDETLKQRYADADERARRVDMLMGAATIIANQDILGFLGGLDSVKIREEGTVGKPTKESVAATFKGGDWLVTEEGSKVIQQAQTPGDFLPYEMLPKTLSRVRLNEQILKLDPATGIMNNLFHGFKLTTKGEEIQFPPAKDVELLNETVRARNGLSGNSDIANMAHKARAVALAFVHAFDMQSPERTKLNQLAEIPDNVLERVFTHQESDKKRSPQEKAKERSPEERDAIEIAVWVLSHRQHGLHNDIDKSPIAVALLKSLGNEEISKLYAEAEKQFGKGQGDERNGYAFISKAREVLGRENSLFISESLRRNRDGHPNLGTHTARVTQELPAGEKRWLE